MQSKSLERTMFYGASSEIFVRASFLRRNMTQSEKVLWEKLRNNKLNGYRFKAQHPIAKFIVDFYCHKALLIIEIDGSVHDKEEVKEHDENRSLEIEKFGLKIVRFSNDQILNEIEAVLKKISSVLE